jgi:hypothetical protein
MKHSKQNPKQKKLIICCEWPDLILVFFLKIIFLRCYRVRVQTLSIKNQKARKYSRGFLYITLIVIFMISEVLISQILSFLRFLASLGRKSHKKGIYKGNRISLGSNFFENYHLQSELTPTVGVDIFVKVGFINRYCGLYEVAKSRPSTLVQIEFLKQNQEWNSLGLKFPTRQYFTKNVTAYFAATASLIDEVMNIDRLRSWQSEEFPLADRVDRHFAKDSSAVIIQLVKTFFYRFRSKFTLQEEYWSIAYVLSNLENAFCKDFTLVPNPPERFFADPYLIKVQDRNYIFVEDIDRRTGKGSISVLRLESDESFQIDRCLIEEFHLSFPFIFFYKGSYYMIPETKEINEIRVYICEEFPSKWSYYKTLMQGVSAVDTQIFEFEGLWWLLTGMSPLGHLGRMSDVVAFYSNNPLSTDWTPYDGLFIVRNSENGRNGGLNFSSGKKYRAGQRYGFDSYGEGLTLSIIDEISSLKYAERKTLQVTPLHKSSISGIHTLTANEDVTVIDFKSKVPPSELSEIKFQVKSHL